MQVEGKRGKASVASLEMLARSSFVLSGRPRRPYATGKVAVLSALFRALGQSALLRKPPQVGQARARIVAIGVGFKHGAVMPFGLLRSAQADHAIAQSPPGLQVVGLKAKNLAQTTGRFRMPALKGRLPCQVAPRLDPIGPKFDRLAQELDSLARTIGAKKLQRFANQVGLGHKHPPGPLISPP